MRLRALPFLVVPMVSLAGIAVAATPTTGGARMPEALSLDGVVCADGQEWKCRQGQRLTIVGAGLDGARRIEFLGRSRADDTRFARPLRQSAASLEVIVPRGARSGRLRVRSYTSDRVTTSRVVAIRAPARASAPRSEAPEPSADGVFPIRGKHDMGQTETNSFGGGRGHQGQDLFAECGTPLVAVRDAVVQFRGTQSAAGNYVVLQDADGRSYAYMHLRSTAKVAKGDRVSAGDPVGEVGQTGRASGCHLHFEIWTAPGWYEGGRPIDPMPQLKRWKAAGSR